MAMNVGPPSGDEDEVVSAINTTPLVDVMLVLLIIFLITIPVVTHVDPGAAAEGAQRGPRDQAGEHRASRSTKDGDIYWNAAGCATTTALIDRLKKIAVLKPQPEVQIRGDGGATTSPSAGSSTPASAPASRRSASSPSRRRAAAERLRPKESCMAMNVGSGGGRAIRT